MASYTYDQLCCFLASARSDTERLAIRQQLIANARAHPADLAPLVCETDTGERMRAQAFHNAWLDLCFSHNRLLLLAPRGHAKSEWISGQYALHRIGRTPSIRILLISTDDDQAAMHTERIKQILASDAYRAIYPDLPPLIKATGLHLKLDVAGAHATWLAQGIKSIGPGPRADLIILDDVVSLKNSRTPALREEIVTTYNTVIRGMLVPGGQVLCVGTPYFEGDLYDYLEGLRDVDGQPIYHVHRDSALYRDGHPQYADDFSDGAVPLWPSRFTLRELQQARLEMGELDFGSQFCCTIIRGSGDVYKRHMLIPTPPAEMPPLVEVWVIADTATSPKATADDTVILTGGRDAQGELYAVNLVRGKWAPADAKAQLIAAHQLAQATYKRAYRGVAYEDTKENHVFGAWLTEAGYRTPAIIKHGGLSKYERAKCVTPSLEQKPLYLQRAAWNGALIDQLCAFSKDGARLGDDQVDAVTYLVAQLLGIKFTRDSKPAPGIIRPMMYVP